MLAFNLDFLFRWASLCRLQLVGALPKGGRPHHSIVAVLVNATFPPSATGTTIDFAWVSSTVRNILQYNASVRIVDWPLSMDQLGFDTWYMRSESHE